MPSTATRPATRGTPSPALAGGLSGSPSALAGRRLRSTLVSRFRGFNQRSYVRGKLAGDPLYRGVADVLAGAPPQPLLDVGCGMGLLGHYLHSRGVLGGYLGIDHDERKIADGRLAAAMIGDALELRCADVADLPDFRGHVALLDVLHYLPRRRQGPLLSQLVRHVAPGGCLIVRNVLRARHWRFHATVLEEHVLHATGWMRVAPSHYPSEGEVLRPLQRAGLQTQVSPLWGMTPFNSYLVVARRPD